jgi:glycosyltransferase involved in cell wall biosynthesis
MKLIVVAASLDLTQPFSATPAWWQLLKAFYEIGVEVVATPYQGPAIESLWWRAAPNPAQWQGDAFKALRDGIRKVASSYQLPATSQKDVLSTQYSVLSTSEELSATSQKDVLSTQYSVLSTSEELSATSQKEVLSTQYSVLSTSEELSAPDERRLIPTDSPITNHQLLTTDFSPATSHQSLVTDSAADRAIRQAVKTFITPLWLNHLDRLLTQNPDADAVLILTAPLNHLVGVAAELQRKHGKPFFYYDGDVPASLPNMSGFASGFRIYQGADPGEYTAVISNSRGGETALRALGAKAVHTVYWGVDTEVFSPVSIPAQDLDVMFYGHGKEYRAQWVEDMLAGPSRALPGSRFAVRGTQLGDLGRTQMLPYLSFSKLREYACRSKINLCITRLAHASVYASSSCRPFELAAMGCCIVANPYLGIEEWFEPGKELFIVHSQEEAIDRYRYLLAHEGERQAVSNRARERVFKQHTAQHRAHELVSIMKGYL